VRAELVKADFYTNLSSFITFAGVHPIYEEGMQIVVRFPNGYGASIALVPFGAGGTCGTCGVELQVFRYEGGWWELVGSPFVNVDAVRVYELLLNIYCLQRGGTYVC